MIKFNLIKENLFLLPSYFLLYSYCIYLNYSVYFAYGSIFRIVYQFPKNRIINFKKIKIFPKITLLI